MFDQHKIQSCTFCAQQAVYFNKHVHDMFSYTASNDRQRLLFGMTISANPLGKSAFRTPAGVSNIT